MALVDRVKNILITPKTEWDVIAGETASSADIVKGYVAPLAAIPVVAHFIGASVIGYSTFLGSFRVPIVSGLVHAVVSYILYIVSIFVFGAVINALAPTFGAQKNGDQAFKVAAYTATASFVGGVFGIIGVLAPLGILAALYGIYLLYLGLPRLMKCPEDKAIGYTAVSIIVMIVLGAVVFGIMAAVGIGSRGMGGMMGGLGSSRGESHVVIDKDSNLGKLEAFGKKMEEAGKKMEAAQKSGNPEEAQKAAMAALGTALGGGKSVDPVGIDQLKPFVPETFAGLAKKSSRAEKTGALGLMVSKAEARYSDDASKSIDLDVSDTGGASGWVALASWAGVQGEKEDQYGTEKTMKVNGRLVHEKAGKDGSSEYSVVLGERFVVSAKARGVDLNTLKGAVASLDLGKLESMKDVGVQK